MKNHRYLIWMGLIIGGFIAFTYALPQKQDWRKTFKTDHKIPFGTYVFYDLVDDILEPDTLIHTRGSISQVFNEMTQDDPVAMILISKEFVTTGLENEEILRRARKGNHFFISAELFRGGLLDSLGISENIFMNIDIWEGEESDNPTPASVMRNGRLDVISTHPGMQGEFSFREQQTPTLFRLDSTANVNVWATSNLDEYAVLVNCPVGKGSITLSASPLALTNYNILKEDNHKFASLALAGLPSSATVVYNTHYLMGGSQANTSMLRYVKDRVSLRYTWYLALILLILFAFFNSKRRQRIIPVMEPPKNTSLEFTETIGRLYYQRRDHANLALKKTEFLLDYIRTKYYLDTSRLDAAFEDRLQKKSGKPKSEIKALVAEVNRFRNTLVIDQGGLLSLNNKIERFYN
ncbi:DUF4350 domain-containing protein [Roseivirga sp. BDSF3-8]|uniref:DUF4350 domain-containing protein n=1 Tax=Roseivirga sp. BDSF3-8 TaxID=3241598 RepID=UPI0035322C83